MIVIEKKDCNLELKKFGVGFHKALKKNSLTFQHYLNCIKIRFFEGAKNDFVNFIYLKDINKPSPNWTIIISKSI